MGNNRSLCGECYQYCKVGNKALTVHLTSAHPVVRADQNDSSLPSNILTFLQRAKTEFAVQVYWPDEDAGPTPADATESWYDVVPTSSLNLEGQSDLYVLPCIFSRRQQLTKLRGSIKRMLKMTPNLYRTRWMNRDSDIDEWIDESGRIVLMGEAAHPWFVSLSIVVNTFYRLITP